MKNIKLILILCLSIITIKAQSEMEVESQMTEKISPLQLISVTIGGDFPVNGSFRAHMAQRLDHFISQICLESKTEIMGITSDYKYSMKTLEEFDRYALRNITVKRADGTELIVDLAKFRISANFDNNPFLKNDDVIIFPPYDIDRDFFTIEGAINKPGKIQFVDGDKLSDAITLAMGINNAFENVEYAEISRLNYDGTEENIIKVKINDDIDLQRGDRIRIVADEPMRKDFSVKIIGEVNQPGIIFITSNNTTLAEVINKAGGIKNTAWLKNIKVLRGEQAKLLDETRIINDFDMKLFRNDLRWDSFLMSRMSNLSVDDTAYFQLENELKFINKAGNIDFEKVLEKDSEANKFIVRDGDVIIIPERIDKIYVFGQVTYPGEYDFKENMNYEYYIDQAGGYGQTAEDDEVVLIKGQSKSWLSFEENDNLVIEPGDYIWVPKEPVRTLAYYLEQAGNIAGILSPIVTIILIITNANASK